MGRWDADSLRFFSRCPLRRVFDFGWACVESVSLSGDLRSCFASSRIASGVYVFWVCGMLDGVMLVCVLVELVLGCNSTVEDLNWIAFFSFERVFEAGVVFK